MRADQMSHVAASNKVFTTGQIARLMSVAPRTVSKWFDSGRLKGYRIPGSQDRRIRLRDLYNFMVENRLPLDILPASVLNATNGGPARLLMVGFSDEHPSLASSPTVLVEYTTTGPRAGMAMSTFAPDCVVVDASIGRIEVGQIAAAAAAADRDVRVLTCGACPPPLANATHVPGVDDAAMAKVPAIVAAMFDMNVVQAAKAPAGASS